ncbi:hypothetical protein KDK_04260 [Dictyobacter kobayashii]|uniref:Adaptive response protein AidB N-terminal domain-containing protein n=1 Tax=Dictyobacter kobayashii TaxID=2014872 RepID=A0A402AC03_9CHLR|nr:hypothetical protein [Dictyobacter kobayashii]GCE16626.1 hypothetical protein KDK_04260 [Dictyobacter kobayashii]
MDIIERSTALSATDKVFNQPPPLMNYNAFTQDVTLAECVRREGADWAEKRLIELGDVVGSEEVIGWGRRRMRLYRH